MRDRKVVKELKNPQYRLASLDRLKRSMRQTLATLIVKAGAVILEKQYNGQGRTIKGCAMLTFTFCREVGGTLTDRMMEKVADRVQT